MNIQFIKDYQDTNPDRVWQAGWTTKVSDPDGQRLIEQGYAIQIADDSRGRMLAPSTPIPDTCITDTQDQPAVEFKELSDDELKAKLARTVKTGSLNFLNK